MTYNDDQPDHIRSDLVKCCTLNRMRPGVDLIMGIDDIWVSVWKVVQGLGGCAGIQGAGWEGAFEHS